MGMMMKDSTTLDVIVQFNKRFETDAVPEMAALQREFRIFSAEHGLQRSFTLLGIVPGDLNERRRWYKFLDHLKTYPSDRDGMNGHDRVVEAFKDDLESDAPLPISLVCHSAAEDPRVMVSRGRPVVFSSEVHVIVSIPTTPGRVMRQQIAKTVRERRPRELSMQ
ncbi:MULTISPECIES: hypothetical protein [unclassified Bradyrhizobium]|uniref:hypothetical protein n=1 Tax=unclassified Bradyrhizobium TaxID=2631580 RepID=UPI0028EBA79E|nr:MULTISPECIES: hypothetical protein [unclassified Bradyrhizobium]